MTLLRRLSKVASGSEGRTKRIVRRLQSPEVRCPYRGSPTSRCSGMTEWERELLMKGGPQLMTLQPAHWPQRRCNRSKCQAMFHLCHPYLYLSSNLVQCLIHLKTQGIKQEKKVKILPCCLLFPRLLSVCLVFKTGSGVVVAPFSKWFHSCSSFSLIRQ